MRLVLLASLVTAGCTAPGAYWRSRGADLLDAVPVSLAHGWGIGISGQATPLLQVGLGVTPISSRRYGFDDRFVNGVWDEFQANLPWSLAVGAWDEAPANLPWLIFVDIARLPDLPSDTPWTQRSLPLVYRWQMVRDAPLGEGEVDDAWEPNVQTHGRHPPLVRESTGALLWPLARRWLEFHDLRLEQGDDQLLASLGSPERATLWRTRREGVSAGRAWDLFELDAFAGIVGVRVGLRPIEFVDFVLGILWLDPLMDDLLRPESWEPQPPGLATAVGAAPAAEVEADVEAAPAAEVEADVEPGHATEAEPEADVAPGPAE